MSQSLGMSKKEMLDSEIENPAMIQALIEKDLLEKTKMFFEQNGMNFDCFEKDIKDTQRSQVTILIKNLPWVVSKEKIKEVFERHGTIKSLFIQQDNAIAVVQYFNIEHAKNAFDTLQGFLINKIPIMLDWAPMNLLQEKHEEILQQAKADNSIQQVSSQQNQVYVKNLNFTTTEETLKNFLLENGFDSFKAISIVKKQGKSLGFGFIECFDQLSAQDLIKKCQKKILEKHSLEFSYSQQKQQQNQAEQKEIKATEKLIIKNMAFQSNKDELQELLKNLIKFRKLRFPLKNDGSCRGFAFLEFDTIEESQQAKKALQGLHFYG